MCIYVDGYVYVGVVKGIYTCVCVYICVWVCIHTYVSVRTYASTHMCVCFMYRGNSYGHICMCVCVRGHMFTHVCKYAFRYVQARIRTCGYICIYVCVCMYGFLMWRCLRVCVQAHARRHAYACVCLYMGVCVYIRL